MTVNPTLGHLYHDFSISNAYTALDVQEIFKTRQRNARERRQLDDFTKHLKKAQDINLRRMELEEIIVRHKLEDINLRTPSLRNGLKQESLRRSKSFSVVSRSTLSSAFPSKCTSAALSRISGASSQTSGVSSSSVGSSDLQLSRSKSQMYVRKVNNVTKSLCKLYEKQQRRKVEREILLRNVRKDNEELLQKSRVYFKESDTTHNLEKILGNASEHDVGKKDQTTSVPDIEKKETVPPENVSFPTLPNLAAITNKVASDTPSSEALWSHKAQPSMSEDFDLSEFKVNAHNRGTIPEVWQLYRQKMAVDENEIREPLLVTITARYRRTLVD
ncbi:uncharacterized protein LOC125651436 [Ostrea edulis]|uniref:uncharacterized protein LOC125651436 n=1 Tax=Ostrea edulis TaxID=37623 RepID=UPI0020958590|nr:uncharacterized protein LOC125651436 [Ostrea edulis]